MSSSSRFSPRSLLAVLAAFAVAPVAWGADAEDPSPLYEWSFNAAERPAPSEAFQDLKQDAAGNWLVGFQHLASFTFGVHRVNYENPAKSFGRPKFGLLRPDDTDTVELPTEPGVSGTIPANVTALDGKKVRISGYMLPLKMENGLVTECLLLRSQMMCCFGRRPELNEWVVVRMKGKGVPSAMDKPQSFYGTLRVGEIFNHGVFQGLYQLDGEKISTP